MFKVILFRMDSDKKRCQFNVANPILLISKFQLQSKELTGYKQYLRKTGSYILN